VHWENELPSTSLFHGSLGRHARRRDDGRLLSRDERRAAAAVPSAAAAGTRDQIVRRAPGARSEDIAEVAIALSSVAVRGVRPRSGSTRLAGA
jgi:hypothetical protein